MSDTIKFISSGRRIMGAYKVCTKCGAHVDSEYVANHVEFHKACA